MSVKTVVAAAAALREVDEVIEAIVAEKHKAIARVDAINGELISLRADRDAKILALKAAAENL